MTAPEIHSAIDRVQFAVDLFLQFNPRAGRSSIGNGVVGRPTGLGSVIVVESRVLRKEQTESSS